jgi:hypothetical protein
MGDKKTGKGLCGFAIVLVGLGTWMLVDPDMMEGAEPGARRAAVKQLLVWIWGVPGGVVLLVLGVLSGVMALRPRRGPGAAG